LAGWPVGRLPLAITQPPSPDTYQPSFVVRLRTPEKELVTDISSDEGWSPAPANSPLPGDAIHIWRASLDPSEERIKQLAQTLSQDEHERSRGFRFEGDRRRFVVGRAVLRDILCRYLAIEPHEVRFRYGPHGKPELADGADLSFSVSHARQFALYAFTQGCDVGIDIEYVRCVPGMESIIERHFTAREKGVLRSLSGSRKLEAFFDCWTSKEAYLKANGRGLTQALESIDVGLPSREPVRHIIAPEASREGGAEEWSLRSVKPDNDYVGALAVARRGGAVSYWTWG
jgi:4'-phosphopantetheinyl transferase